MLLRCDLALQRDQLLDVVLELGIPAAEQRVEERRPIFQMVSSAILEKRKLYLLLVSIIFPIIVFIFFETILGLRFPPGIITNIYYN